MPLIVKLKILRKCKIQDGVQDGVCKIEVSRSNMIFLKIKVGTSVIPQYDAILTGQSICGIIFMI